MNNIFLGKPTANVDQLIKKHAPTKGGVWKVLNSEDVYKVYSVEDNYRIWYLNGISTGRNTIYIVFDTANNMWSWNGRTIGTTKRFEPSDDETRKTLTLNTYRSPVLPSAKPIHTDKFVWYEKE